MDHHVLHKNASPSSLDVVAVGPQTILEEGEFTEPQHQLPPYHISKITLIFFITTVIGIKENLYVTEIQALFIQMLPF